MKTMLSIFLAVIVAAPITANTNSVPADLSVVKIMLVPFILKYDGSRPIAMGGNTNGFDVVAMTPDEITLKHGDKVIRIRKGEAVPYTEYIVTILDKSNGKQYEARTGNPINIGSGTYALDDVNLKQGSCTLRDLRSGETWTISKMKVQQNSLPASRAP